MTYRLIYTSSFKKDVRLAEKKHLDMNALTEVLEWLKSGKKLPEKYCDHQLKGKLKKFRELHIQPDWILVYIKNKTELPKKSHFTLESKELDFSVRHSMVLRIP